MKANNNLVWLIKEKVKSVVGEKVAALHIFTVAIYIAQLLQYPRKKIKLQLAPRNIKYINLYERLWKRACFIA